MQLMNIYWVVHCFVEEGQNDKFHLRFGVKLQGVKNEEGSIICDVSIDLSNPGCIISIMTVP